MYARQGRHFRSANFQFLLSTFPFSLPSANFQRTGARAPHNRTLTYLDGNASNKIQKSLPPCPVFAPETAYLERRQGGRGVPPLRSCSSMPSKTRPPIPKGLHHSAQQRVGPIPRGLPWATPFKFHNPEKVEYQALRKKIQPFQGRESYGRSPRVARSPAFATLRRGKSQHRCWAKRFNPFGIGNAHGHSAKITQAETVLYQVVMVYSSRPAENSCKFILTFARQRLR